MRRDRSARRRPLRTLAVRFPYEEKQALEYEAAKRGYTPSDLTRLFIREGMARIDELAPPRDLRVLVNPEAPLLAPTRSTRSSQRRKEVVT